MSTPQVYTWPIADEDAVALLQTTAGADTLLLNGALSNPNNRGLFVDFGKVSRVVTLTSANNLGAVNVTIAGTLNGVVVTETRVGPNNNTVATTQVFSSVTSITVDDAVTAMSVGTGVSGYTKWFKSNKYPLASQLAVQVDATATVSYSFQVTLDEVNGNNSPLTFTPVVALTTASADQLGVYTVPFNYCRVAMVTSDATGAMTVTMLQQGTHS